MSKKGPEYLMRFNAAGNCEILSRAGVVPPTCQLPEESRCAACPLPVSQTGDRSFAQVMADYREMIAPKPAPTR